MTLWTFSVDDENDDVNIDVDLLGKDGEPRLIKN